MKINPPPDTPEREAVGTAIHETSHAEVSRTLGYHVTTIKLVRDGGLTKVKEKLVGLEGMAVLAAGYIGEGWWLHSHYGLPLRTVSPSPSLTLRPWLRKS